MQFSDLNDDIVLCILDAIKCDDLDAFCSINRRVYDLAANLLSKHREMKRRYYRIDISLDSETEESVDWYGHPVNILHEIHNDPRVADYVREIEFDAFEFNMWNYADSDGFNQYRPLTQRRIREHGERLLKALAQVDLIPSFDDIEIRDDAEINFGPQPGQLDTSSLFVYLLTLTTQVIRIEVTDPYWRLHHRCLNAFGRLAQLQGVTSPAPLFLERLQTVRVKRIWHDQPPIVPIFIFFRSWTSVKSLVAGELRRPYSYTSRDWPVSQAFCEELAFENSFVVPEPVEDLIRGVALRSFKCELTVDENGGGKYIRDVLGVLERHVASTLEELTLLGGDYTHSTVLYRIGSLKGFVCLKKLVIDLGCYCSDTTSIGVEWDDDHTSRGKDNLELLRRNRVASFIDFLTILPECIESLDAIIMYSQPRPLEWDHRIRCGPEESGPSKDFNGEAMREALDKERTNRLTKLRSVRLMDGDRFDCRWPADINEEKAASAWVTM